VKPVLRQQVHALPYVLTEPLPAINIPISQPAVRRAIGRRIHLLPVTSDTDELCEHQTAIALSSVYAQETLELQLPVTSQLLQEKEISLVVGSGTDPGIRRKHKPNEDSILQILATNFDHGRPLPVGLFVVADGMGGHASGQEASQLAIQVLSDSVMSAVRNDIGDEEALEQLLADAAYHANLAIHECNLQEKKFMGTTVTAALVVGTTAYIVNVGDSRAYLYRQCDGLTQLTRDHSVVARLVEENMIQPDEIYTHPRRNEIYRCLGERESVEVDTFMVPLQAGDSLLLCSDGLWEMVRDPDIQAILQSTLDLTSSEITTSQASTELIEAALKGGGLDNISVIVVHVR
jgi:serine/threonine protein phosphatase PrpC